MIAFVEIPSDYLFTPAHFESLFHGWQPSRASKSRKDDLSTSFRTLCGELQGFNQKLIPIFRTSIRTCLVLQFDLHFPPLKRRLIPHMYQVLYLYHRRLSERRIIYSPGLSTQKTSPRWGRRTHDAETLASCASSDSEI